MDEKRQQHRLHSGHIEVATARLIGWRRNTIVPNVSWGLGVHECDMLVLDDQNRFTEIEVKISASDLKADFRKGHGHRSKIISRLVYAMPQHLCEKYEDLIPEGCGIISVFPWRPSNDRTNWIPLYKAEWWRMARHKVVDKPSDKLIRKFMELGCMRIWSLKETNYQLSERLKEKNHPELSES